MTSSANAAPEGGEGIPGPLRLLVAFLLALAACELAALLTAGASAQEIGRALALRIILRGLLALLCVLLAVQLLLRVPFARACALALLALLPAVKAFRYVLFPTAWQIAGTAGRMGEFISAGILLFMASLLLRGRVAAWLAGEGGRAAGRGAAGPQRMRPPDAEGPAGGVT